MLPEVVEADVVAGLIAADGVVIPEVVLETGAVGSVIFSQVPFLHTSPLLQPAPLPQKQLPLEHLCP